MAVTSAGPYASLHLAQDRQPRQHSATRFLKAGCPSCRPTNSVKALISPACRANGSKPTTYCCSGRMGQTDRRMYRQMDIVQFHRPCSAYNAGSAKNGHTHTHNRLMAFVRGHLSGPVPEETVIHSDSSIISKKQTHTHTRLTALCPGLPR